MNEGRLAGIDYSTFAIDLVLLEPGQPPTHHRYPLVGHDAFDRARYVRHAMPPRTAELWDDVLAIAIEQPAGHHGLIPLVRIQGALLACLPPLTLIQPYLPARWRVLNGLHGHALKTHVAQHSILLGAPPDWKQDAHDAHLIARALLADLKAQEAA